MRFKYTDEHLDYLRGGYLSMNVRDLTVAFNARFKTDKSEKAIKTILNRHKIRCGRKTGERLITRKKLFTDNQVAYLRELRKGRSLIETTLLFNAAFKTEMKVSQIRSCAKRNGIKSGLHRCFPKGHTPWNLGTKGVMKPNSGNFPKGHKPENQRPVGSERTCGKDGSILVKVAETDPYTGYPTRWKYKHVVVWESLHGPVPKGMVVAFRDSDRTNCDIDNLLLVSRAELLRMNKRGYRKMPEELKPSVLALSKLEVRMFKKVKESEKC